MSSQKLTNNKAHKAGRTMEDNNPDTLAELNAGLAAIAPKPTDKPFEPTSSEATRRWIDSLSDCA
jgi:hypothetical protein